MAALISWLDASPEEQRKVREIVRMFSQRETQDEMGGRRIVVALSDALFPGTSVLHSRARYLLFIPWLLQRAASPPRPALPLPLHSALRVFESEPPICSARSQIRPRSIGPRSWATNVATLRSPEFSRDDLHVPS